MTDKRDEEFPANRLFEARYGNLIRSGRLSPGSEPRMFSHGKKTEDVIVLVHGLSDSPHYVSAIGRRFHEAGANVLLPLLPGHGLKDLGGGMGRWNLHKRWQHEIDAAVGIAREMGERISLGGFSTGAVLSIDKLIRSPKEIQGGLFLFSAALQIHPIAERMGRSYLLGLAAASILDRRLRQRLGVKGFPGLRKRQYKYPVFPNQGAVQLARLLFEMSKTMKSRGGGLENPVFAAHAEQDESAYLDGIVRFFHLIKGNRELLILTDPEVDHPNLTLKDDLMVEENAGETAAETQVSGNPRFQGMMNSAINFFNEFIRNHHP